MLIAIYARVSTDEQSVQTQIDECLAYARARGWRAEIFRDEGISGSQRSRPEFDKMLERAKAGEFGAVMVWRFDRASRSTQHLLQLLKELSEMKVDFISLRENIDTSTAVGKLMFTMVSAFAQFERDLISDRTKAAMKRLKSEGKQVGRAQVIDRNRIRFLSRCGKSVREISGMTAVSQAHVRRILKETPTAEEVA